MSSLLALVLAAALSGSGLLAASADSTPAIASGSGVGRLFETVTRVQEFLASVEARAGEARTAEGGPAGADDDSASAPEVAYCAAGVGNAVRCAQALRLAGEARSQTASRFGVVAPDGRGDAFRHCMWSARMTQELGANAARGFGDRHEQRVIAPGQSQAHFEAARAMDLDNNVVGREIGVSVSFASQAGARCATESQRGGQLRVLGAGG